MSNRHRGMQGYLDDYYDDEDYYEDEYYDDYYPESTPVAKKPSATATTSSKKVTNQMKNIKIQNNTPKKQSSNSSNKSNTNSKSKTDIKNNKTSGKETSTLNSNSVSKIKPEPILKNIIELSKKSERKPVLNLVVIGHVDSGKSTLTGHFLLKRGLVSNQEFHKLSKEAENQNKASFKFAYILDDDETEREKGVTISTTKKTFLTNNFTVALADAPGHRDFVPNMISGAANADAAILVVDARNGEFEAGFSNSGQTKEHALIIKSLGVSKLIVAVNKMDAPNIEWNKDRFDVITAQLRKFLTKSVGFRKNDIVFTGVSGLTGENLTERKFKAVPCLMELIDMIQISERPLDKPARLSISDLGVSHNALLEDAVNLTETKISCLGRVELGTIQINQQFMLQPDMEGQENKQIVEISAIYKEQVEVSNDNGTDDDDNFLGNPAGQNNEHDQYALAGEHIGFDIKPINFSKFTTESFENISSSSLFLSSPKTPMSVAKKFTARILILGGDAQTYDNVAIPPITKGFQISCHINCNTINGKIAKILHLIDKTNGQKLDEHKKIRLLNKGDAAEVQINLEKELCLDFVNNVNTRFTVRIQGITIGSGVFREKVG